MKSKLCAVSGFLYAGFTILISRLLIRYLDVLWIRIHSLFHLPDTMTEHIQLVLHQFYAARILSPWLPFLLICGLITVFFSRKQKPFRILLPLGIVLWIPFLALVLWFTTINDIRLGALLHVLLPMFI